MSSSENFFQQGQRGGRRQRWGQRMRRRRRDNTEGGAKSAIREQKHSRRMPSASESVAGQVQRLRFRNNSIAVPTKASISSNITQTAIQALLDSRHTSPPADIILNRSPKRLPTYLFNSSRTYFGYVFRDIMTRMCSRHIAQSHILVVSPGASEMATTIEQDRDTQLLDSRKLNFSIVGSTLLYAARQGHAIDGLEPADELLFRNASALPSWTLLALIDAEYDTDRVIRQAQDWLRNTTVTYLILSVGADPDGRTFGQYAAMTLHNQHKYKVQLLSLSHFRVDLKPNLLLQQKKDMSYSSISTSDFFAALKEQAQRTNTPVRGYLFCTQGLDLAIPAATQYVQEIKRDGSGIVYQECQPSNVTLEFSKDSKLAATCNSVAVPQEQLQDVWMSRHDDLEHSEAACAQIPCQTTLVSACATRIIRQQQDHFHSVTASGKNNISRPNLLVLMLDPMSRARFERSLPRTSRLMEKLDFVTFSNFTAVGNNSGPNQAALYSGYPLHSRDTIATHLKENETSNAKQWLWDTLKEEGYVTFKAEDGCIENSNMVQSLRPETHHGEALTRMMCYDFQRPNCVAHKSVAQYMIEHCDEFMGQYSGRNPWAAFLHFIDSHEDTMTLEATLDTMLWRFLYSIYDQQDDRLWNSTLILLLSDHGLHYGSYLLSPEGRKERSQPILNVHVPSGMAHGEKQALSSNARLHATHFDVYQTILDALRVERKHGVGATLLQPLPDERRDCLTTRDIPADVCSILNPTSERVLMPDPPSMLSFYADIPLEQRNALPVCQEENKNQVTETTATQRCICASNRNEWHNCSAAERATRHWPPSETFQLVDCEGKHSIEIDIKPDPAILRRPAVQAKAVRPNILFLEIDSVSYAYADRHFPKTRELLEKYRLRSDSSGGYECPDNLCSVEFSFFSVTGANSIPNQVSVFGGCIVLTGPERCMTTTVHGKNTLCDDASSFAHGMFLVNTFRSITQTWCRTPNDPTSPSPWIFDIAKKAGYVTLFAEEFCYDRSKYVTQNNIFPLNADFLPHQMFCREAERTALLKGTKIRGPYWRFEVVHNDGPCLAKHSRFPKIQVSLEHVEKMWDAYPDTPKLAYVNAMAAHTYSDYREMAPPAEAYDTVLSSFLEGMLRRADADNTLIVLRGDHGLQGGPNVADYALQIEALRPWTELVVPKSFPNLSLSTLLQNQERLATGSDLYRTLAESIIAGDNSLMAEPSPWTINFLKQQIPRDRTCADAKVPPHYCLFESDRTFSSPNYATCNPQERNQDMACPISMKRFHNLMAAEVEQEFTTRTIESETCTVLAQNSTSSQVFMKQQWSALDRIVDSHPGSKVSGGIFLYPRQSRLLHSIVRLLSEIVLEREDRNLNVCETGFGAGHSAALFLSSSKNVNVYTFDKFDRPYQLPALEHLKSEHGDRVVHHSGSSCESVPSYLTLDEKLSKSNAIQCDFLHGSSLCPTDNIDLVENSQCGAILTSTAMNSVADNKVYFGPNGQWTSLKKRGCVRDIACFDEEETTLDRDFVFNRDGAQIAHKFCIAISTGACRNPDKAISNPERPCENAMGLISHEFNFSRICRAYQHAVPA